MKYRLFPILFLIFITVNISFSQVTKQNTPLWVNKVSYKDLNISDEDAEQGTLLLLFDQQVNTTKKTIYYKFATKITDNSGIQNASTISVAFDPSYQKLRFHFINIIRDGKVIDKLDISNFQTIRRELNADNYLYDGSLSAIMNLSDVRMGDIIEYSYSIEGFNPIHKGKFSTTFHLNDYSSVGIINVDIISNKKINYKLFNNAIAPSVSTQNNLHRYNWNVITPEKVEWEENTPSWKIIQDMVVISDYNSWEEVVNWGLNLYKVNESLSSQLKVKIKDIKSTYENEGDQIKATLDFVQNEVRYLGLEYGIGAYKPYSPNKVFEQRFGDCKDKSLLVIAMLREMGIKAYPMLINTYLKHTIKEFLPSPIFFDHCVVKVVDKDKTAHWYDPTITNQGGSFRNTYFPNYAYGLVLNEENNDFDSIQPSTNNRVETSEEYTLDTIGGGAKLKVYTVYYSSEADNMRRYFKSNSIKTITKEYENFYSNYFNYVSSTKEPKIHDNIAENEIKVYEEYQIDSLWTPMVDKKGYIAATFVPSSLTGVLYTPTKLKRQNEFDIVYPVTKYHDIKINLPEPWNLTNDFVSVNSSSFYYDWRAAYNRKTNQVEVSHILETKKSYITPTELSKYKKDLNQIDQSFGYVLFISEDYNNNGINIDTTGLKDGFKLVAKSILILLLIIGVILFWYSKHQNKSNLRD